MYEPKNYLLDIVELRRCGNEEYANKYIAEGWLLLNQFAEERGTFGSYGIVYILGRPQSVAPDPTPEPPKQTMTADEEMAEIERLMAEF